jgi:flagellar biosynthetic protein FlhB
VAEESDDADKTEDPTRKRLDDALERGDVVKSQEVNTWFIIAGATLVISSFSGTISSNMQVAFRNLIANSFAIPTDGGSLLALLSTLEHRLLIIFAVPLVVIVVAAIAGNMVQHRLVWSTQALKPSLSKISPASGLKRIFGKQAFANLIKGLLKIALLGAVFSAILWPQRYRLEGMVRQDLVGIVDTIRGLALHLLGAAVALLAVVAAADYFFQYRQWFERQKMSVREMKEEFKSTEGDPHIKGRIRALRQARMKKRMMAAVPTASVVITNPTHFAVALQYEKGMPAPICVAKGIDAIALKIREVAAKHDVPVVENPPLARALHATVEVDQEIPVEHYQAVAQVIGYVMRLKRGFAGNRAAN